MKYKKLKYYINNILKLLVVTSYILLFFSPTINELYEVYAHNHSLHCTAKNENHLHKDHETFFYNITVVNEYIFTNNVNITHQLLFNYDVTKAFPKGIELTKRLVIFFSRPPPFFN